MYQIEKEKNGWCTDIIEVMEKLKNELLTGFEVINHFE